MVDMGDCALYASPDGLVMASGNSATTVTDSHIDREYWQSLDPSTIRGFKYEGRYIGFYGTEGDGFILDFEGESEGRFVTFDGFDATAGYYDGLEDMLYIANGTSLAQFNSGTPLTFTWQTKEYLMPYHLAFVAARLEATDYPFTLTVYTDGIERGVFTIPDNRVFRFPLGYVAQLWQFKLEGTGSVDGLFIADAMAELN
jgi:hypothetical protein